MAQNLIDQFFSAVFGIFSYSAPKTATNASGSSAVLDSPSNPPGIPNIKNPHKTIPGGGVIVKTADGVFQVDPSDFVQSGEVQTVAAKGDMAGLDYTVKGGAGDPATVEGALAIGWVWAVGRPGSSDTRCNMRNSDGSRVLLLPFKYASTPRDIAGKTDAQVYSAALQDAQGEGLAIPTGGAEGFVVGQAASQVPFGGAAISLFNSITADDPREVAAQAVANRELTASLDSNIPVPPAYIQQSLQVQAQIDAIQRNGGNGTLALGSDLITGNQTYAIETSLRPNADSTNAPVSKGAKTNTTRNQ